MWTSWNISHFLLNTFDEKMDQCWCFISLFFFFSKWIKNFLQHRHNPIDTIPMVKKIHMDRLFSIRNCIKNECFSILFYFFFFVFCELQYTYLTALQSVVIMLLLMLEFRLVHCFDDADVLSSDRFFLLHKSSLFS